MARRAPVDEKPFRPLDVSVLSAVLQHAPEARGDKPQQPARVVEVPLPAPRSAPLAPAPAATAVLPEVPRFDQEKRILFTREETLAIDRLINNLAVRLRTQVKVSHVLRALTTLLLHAESQVDQRAGESGAMVRPSNGDYTALKEFEQGIARILAHAIRDAGELR